MTRLWPWVGMVVLLLAGCQQGQQVEIERTKQEQPAPDVEATVLPQEAPKLSDELAAKRSELQQGMSEEVKQKLAEAQQKLDASGAADRALQVGDAMPEFELTDASGTKVKSADLLATGPAVIVFHRGGWCPYCDLTIRAYQRAEADFRAAGVKLVAIAPEPADKAAATIAQTGARFDLLSDPGCQVASLFGVAYELDPGVRETYQQLGFNVGELNGDGSWKLPLPATYVVGTDEKIVWASVGTDCAQRVDPAEVVAAAKAASERAVDPASDIAKDEVSLDALDQPLLAPPVSGPAEAAPSKTTP